MTGGRGKLVRERDSRLLLAFQGRERGDGRQQFLRRWQEKLSKGEKLRKSALYRPLWKKRHYWNRLRVKKKEGRKSI